MSELLMKVERASRWLPAPLRRLGRRILRRSGEAAPIIPGWDQPLFGEGPIEWPPRISPSDDLPRGEQVEVSASSRCLLVTGTLDAGGMDEFVAFLARGLVEHGIDTAALLAPLDEGKPNGGIASELRRSGIEVVDGAQDRPYAEAWVRGWQPDVIAVHGNATWPVDLGNALAVPVVLVLHGMHDLFGADEVEVLTRYRKVAMVICVSELVRQQYLALSPQLDPAKVITIPNGIDARRAAGVERSSARSGLGLTDEFLFVSLSRHALQKNTYGLLAAFGDVAKRSARAHLLVCGREDDLAYTRQVVALRERLEFSDRIHLRGNTTRPDVLLAAADAFVLDSFFEGWALASMEALVAGVPVILSEVGGAREQIEGGPARGILVRNPLGDPISVNWKSMASARFSRQSNRDELVSAMLSVVDGSVRFDSPSEIAADAVERFSDRTCLQRHARALRDAARLDTQHGVG